jgi:hypothetical protein
MHHTVFALCLLAVAALPRAQDISLLAGQTRVEDGGERSFGAKLSYTYPVGAHRALSASYLNEGHPQLHHRDGLGAQFWLTSGIPWHGWSLGAGIGPYFYFDTTTGSGATNEYSNNHGWGALYSLSARWHPAQRWYLELQANRIHLRDRRDTTLLLLGIGYQLQNLPAADSATAPGNGSLTLSAGRTIVNSFESEQSGATGLEYRRALSENVEWSALLLDEGSARGTRRRGVATQGWLVQALGARVVLGLGAGLYVITDQPGPDQGAHARLAPLASIGLGYRLGPKWRAQLTWSRIISDNQRDADVFLLGLGAAL